MYRLKILMICCLLWPVTAALAQTPKLAPKNTVSTENGPIDNIMANKIYSECTNDRFRFQGLNPIDHGFICSCLSTGYQSELTVEEYKSMTQYKDGAGRKVYERMLGTVYFPCITMPLKRNILQDCLRRSSLGGMGDATRSGCNCVVRKIANYIEKIGIPQILLEAARHKTFTEPYGALVNGGEYQSALTNSYYACFNGRVP